MGENITKNPEYEIVIETLQLEQLTELTYRATIYKIEYREDVKILHCLGCPEISFF